MHMINLTLALCLIISGNTTHLDKLQNEVKSIMYLSEIMDAREWRYMMSKREELQDDFKMLMNRAHDLRDAPFLSDHHRFAIGRDEINALLVFNRQYMTHLQSMRGLFPNDAALMRVIAETDALYQAWDSLRDAKTDYYYCHVRRQALMKLKSLIGAEAFERGAMPGNVPEWRFVEVR